MILTQLSFISTTLLLVAAIILMIMTQTAINGRQTIRQTQVQEPDYDHLLYGSVWRHTVLSPGLHISDVARATEYVQALLEKLKLGLDPAQTHQRCICQNVLWYTQNEQSPVLLDSHLSGDGDINFPVSVPVSLGSTLTFCVKSNETGMAHTLIVTQYFEDFYLYSHTWHMSSCQYGNRESIVLGLPYSSASVYHRTGDSCLSDTTYVGSGKNIKIMTYNIWNFNTHQKPGSYKDRVKKISKLLQESSPDIVGFQEMRLEVPSGGELGPNQVNHLSEALPGYQFVYQPAQLMRESFHHGRSEEGVAIFSRFPIIHHDYYLLFRNRANSADTHQRICLHAVILLPETGRVHVYNTHLSLSHEAREISLSQIRDFIVETAQDEPAVLLGDLNATPDEEAIRMMSDNTGFVDVWQELYPSSSGFTFNTLEDDLSKRIDYIFVRKSEKVTPESIKVVPDQTGSAAASDHRPVMAALHIQAGGG